jgi:hypothetical protein
MGGWEIWLALVFAAAVWILGHLLRQGAQTDEKRDQPRPGAGERRPPGRPPGAAPRQPPRTELDRFLQEVNRRKQLAEQRGRAQQPASAPPERRPPRPRTVAVERPPARRMVEPMPEVISVEPTRRAEPVPVLELAEAQARPATVPPAAPVPVVPTGGAAGSVVLGPATPFPPAVRQGQSGAIRRLGAMLRSKDNLCAAMMLREILDRPVCHRRRGR